MSVINSTLLAKSQYQSCVSAELSAFRTCLYEKLGFQRGSDKKSRAYKKTISIRAIVFLASRGRQTHASKSPSLRNWKTTYYFNINNKLNIGPGKLFQPGPRLILTTWITETPPLLLFFKPIFQLINYFLYWSIRPIIHLFNRVLAILLPTNLFFDNCRR